ncbi:MAG: hypothetical protein IPM43_01845 [Actinomycetota bacterium]|nr:MAG: hypothetical protein IPM43_01845 [Actinomycetota bacterium]
MTVLVGTTLAAMAMSHHDTWSAWLMHAERIRQFYDGDVHFFAAIQLDGRGIDPFVPLLARLDDLGGEHWTYTLDDGRDRVTMTNRWRHITFGQNLVVERAQSDPSVSHLLFCAADCAPPSDVIPRMLEMNHPLVAPYINTYGLRGDHVAGYPFPVERAMASAACVFIARDVFRRIRWRWDLDDGMSDDPCYHHDAQHLLGVDTLVRLDVRARHYPEAIGDYEARGLDTTVVR